MSVQVPAGWYPDPEDASFNRYWDGQAWSQSRIPAATSASNEPATPAPEGTAPSPSTTSRGGTRAKRKSSASPQRKLIAVIGSVAAVLVIGLVVFFVTVPKEEWLAWGVGAAVVLTLAFKALDAILSPDGDNIPSLLCPHCNTKGNVYRKAVKESDGISGGKATGAILTGGTSLWLTGLSKQYEAAKLRCKSCDSRWAVRR